MIRFFFLKLNIHQQKLSWMLMILLSLFHLQAGILPGWEKIQDDFPNYYVSAKLLSHHQDLSVLYSNELFNEKIKSFGLQPVGQFALYAPPNALILLPLSGLTPITAKRVWLSVNVLLIFVCGFLIKKITRLRWVASLNLLLLSGFALTNDLFLGQVYLFTTTLLLLGILFFYVQKNYLSGLLLGTVLAFKYVSIGIVPTLFILRKWKVLFGMMVGALMLNIICLPFFGTTLLSYFYQHVFFSHINGLLYEGRPYAVQYQSWDSLLNNLFVYDEQFNSHPFMRSITLFYVIKFSLLTMVLTLLSWFFIRTFRNQYFFDITTSLSLISLLILEPGSATYHNLFLLLPFILILRLMIIHNCRLKFVYIACFALIGFIPAVLNRYTIFNGINESHSSIFFILSFHRLWFEMVFYFCSVYFLYSMIKDNSHQKLHPVHEQINENF